MTKIQIAIIAFVVLLAAVIALIFVGVIPGLKPKPNVVIPKIEMSLWGYDGDTASLQEATRAYQSKNPAVEIKISTFPKEDYERNLIENLAALTGPDMFVFPPDWLTRHENKIVPASENLVSPERVAEIFPKLVADDFIKDGKAYALPLFINTLALAYNRDILDSKQVASPPAAWDAINASIPKIRELKSGKIAKSAISLGGTEDSVQNAIDILALLMMQGGISMPDERVKRTSFGGDAAEYLKRYLEYSDPKSKVYTLDDSQKNSLDAFAEGSSAMVFVYPSGIKAIKSKNPTLNLRLLPMPQLSNEKVANIADYWGLAVSKNSKNQNLAWNFINFAATDPGAAAAYLASSGNSPALRSLIPNYAESPILKVFAPQALSAVSWPRFDAKEVRSIVNSMIESSMKDRASYERIFEESALEISKLAR